MDEFAEQLGFGFDVPAEAPDAGTGFVFTPAITDGKLTFLKSGGIYGIWVYCSMFGSRAAHDYDSARDAQKVYNFKKYGQNRDLVKGAFEFLASELGCDVIVACPGHTTEDSTLQGIFGASLRRVAEVPSRKYDHRAEIDFDYQRQTLEIDDDFVGRVRGGKVLVVDDVATTGKTLVFYKLLFESIGVQAEVAAIGLNKGMLPVRDGPVYELPKSAPKSGAERTAEMVSRRAEIGPLLPVRDPGRRAAAEASLVDFGRLYALSTPDWNGFLEREPSEGLVHYAETIQRGIEGAGLLHIRLGRGSGKSTWAKLGLAWAAATGRLKFPVVVSAKASLAHQILADIWTFFETSPNFGDDFPEVSQPIRALDGKPQRAAGQTLDGVRTMIHRTVDSISLPQIAGKPCNGATFAALGAGAAIRGLVRGGRRPDFVMLDDIQTREDALSQKTTQKLVDWVRGDVLGLGGSRQLSAVMTSTPICDGDVSEHFADAGREPSWTTISRPSVLAWPERMDLWQEYCDLVRNCLANGDQLFAEARGFYDRHAAEMERGASMFDPGNYDPRIERSATQHAFDMLVRVGEQAFQAEYMLRPPRPATVVALTLRQVAGSVNGSERDVLPRGTSDAVAFVDVMATGLHWCLCAFGPGQVGAVVDYGRYPERGRLCPEGVDLRTQQETVARGLYDLLRRLHAIPLRDADGRPASLHAAWIDHRWLRSTVTQLARLMRERDRLNVWTCAGFDSAHYADGAGRRVVHRGDGVDFRESEDGVRFAAQNSDRWKEAAQRAFLAPPLTPGSLSLYGDDPAAHTAFADQVTAERLSDKAVGAKGFEIYRWTLRPGAENHWLDCLGGCLAAASWYRFWDAADVAPSVMAAASGSRKPLPQPSRPAAPRVPRRFSARRRA